VQTLKELGTGDGWIAESTTGPYGVGGVRDSPLHNKGFLDPDLYVFESKTEVEAFIEANDLSPLYRPVQHQWDDMPEDFKPHGDPEC
jgi:hypothetical protein